MPEWLVWTLVGGGGALLFALLWLLSGHEKPNKRDRRTNEAIVRAQSESLRNQTFHF